MNQQLCEMILRYGVIKNLLNNFKIFDQRSDLDLNSSL